MATITVYDVILIVFFHFFFIVTPIAIFVALKIEEKRSKILADFKKRIFEGRSLR